MVSRRSRLDARQPIAGQLTRCLLYPNMELAHQMSMWAVAGKQRLWWAASQPLVALDVGPDTVRVSDAKSNAVIATAPRAQVSAAPETYKCRRWLRGPPYKQPPPSPVLVLCVPGAEPMTIGCQETSPALAFAPRFAWRGPVRDRVNKPADYSVAAGDWLMLVERFGLTAHLVDTVHRATG